MSTKKHTTIDDLSAHTSVDIVDLAREASEIGRAQGRPPRRYYAVTYGLIINGQVPAEKIGGRWYLARADLPLVFEKLGLESQPENSPKTLEAARAVVTF